MSVLVLFAQIFVCILVVESTVDMYAEYYPCAPPVQSTLIHGIPPTITSELSMYINDETLSDFNINSGYAPNTRYQIRIESQGNKMYYIWAYDGTINGAEHILCDGRNLLEYFVSDLVFNWQAPPQNITQQNKDCEILIMYATHHTALNLQSFTLQPSAKQEDCDKCEL